MKITILAAGKLRSGPEKAIIDEYKKRLKWPLSITELIVKNESRDDVSNAIMDKLLGIDAPFIVVLDERGKTLSSPEFASTLEQCQIDGVKDCVFVIGGADGLNDAVRKRANVIVSFGRLTWPHFMVRAMLTEQIYRAQQIIAGHPYHRD